MKWGTGVDTDLEIRPLTEADAQGWRELRLRMLRDHPDVFGSSWEEFAQQSLEEVARRMRERNAPPDNALFGAFMDGELIGSTGLHREEGAKDRHKAMIWGVYTAPETRGRGVGRALMNAAIARARATPGLERLTLAVATHNTAARALYVSLGFAPWGLERHALKLPDRYIDEEYFALDLEERGS
jgi:RimJ/RimL family protein N-acetyltransferase